MGGLKRRKHHSSSSTNSDGASTIAAGDHHHHGHGELEIVHLSMEESRDCHARQVSTGYVDVPMNYWLTATDDEGEGEEDDDGRTASSSPSYSRAVDGKDTGCWDGDSDVYVPLRIPEPQPPVHARPIERPMQPRAQSAWPRGQSARYSQDEWQEKAGEALFGSLRSRNKMSMYKQKGAGTKRGREQCEESAAASGDMDDDHHHRSVVTFNGWTEKERPLFSKNKQNAQHIPNKPPVRQPHVDLQSPSFLSLSSVESSPIFTHTSPQNQCTNALNELLFATNAHVESELHGLPQCYIDGRMASKFGSDFNTIVSHAYDDFVPAAQSVLSTISQMTDAHAAVERTGLLETLVAEIVARYADETSSAQARRHYDDYAIYTSDDLRPMMDAMGISVVKYSKEQMVMYATTSISKYVSSQVLLSTGIENDLVDKLESCTQALDVVMGQIDVVESLRGPDDHQKADKDLCRLRRKAASWETQIRQLQADVADASHIRKTFELVLMQVQAL
ncbi:hypothetical protein IW138_001848 [Coemansia sp. RSA 986]|nr:hypothetical protein IW138_001848 [Coemansia sp. RSA 986]